MASVGHEGEVIASIQWSMARTPVDSQTHSGVVRVRAGSRMTREGSIFGCVQRTFSCVVEEVPPPKRLYSPAERVVGMQIMGIVMSGPGTLEEWENEGRMA